MMTGCVALSAAPELAFELGGDLLLAGLDGALDDLSEPFDLLVAAGQLLVGAGPLADERPGRPPLFEEGNEVAVAGSTLDASVTAPSITDSGDRFSLTGRAGAIDWSTLVFRPEDADTYRDSVKPGMSYNNWRTYQVSDHLILWVELQADHADDYLRRRLEYGPPQ